MGSRVTLPFGKYKGDRLEDVPSTYLVWLLESEAVYDGPLRRAVVMEVIHRIAPKYKPSSGGFDEQEPTRPGQTYDPGGVFSGDQARQQASTSEPRPTVPGAGRAANGMMRSIVDEGYRALARKYHPDRGGSDEQMKSLNAAAEVLRKAVPR